MFLFASFKFPVSRSNYLCFQNASLATAILVFTSFSHLPSSVIMLTDTPYNLIVLLHTFQLFAFSRMLHV